MDKAHFEMLESLAARGQTAVSHWRIRNALTALLWLSGIISLPCFIMALVATSIGHEPLGQMMFFVGVAPVAATIIAYMINMVVAPQRNQSEEFQTTHEVIELIREKGSRIAVLPSSLEAIAFPPASQPRRGDEQ